MNEYWLDEIKEKKVKEISNNTPPPNGPKIILGLIFFAYCPVMFIWLWNSIIPGLSRHIPFVVLQFIFILLVFLHVFCAIAYLYKFFLYKFFPNGFMGLKAAWWDKATANFDKKNNLIAKDDTQRELARRDSGGKVKDHQK